MQEEPAASRRKLLSLSPHSLSPHFRDGERRRLQGLFFPAHGEAATGADVIVGFLIQQHEQQAFPHRHGRLAFRTINLTDF